VAFPHLHYECKAPPGNGNTGSLCSRLTWVSRDCSGLNSVLLPPGRFSAFCSPVVPPLCARDCQIFCGESRLPLSHMACRQCLVSQDVSALGYASTLTPQLQNMQTEEALCIVVQSAGSKQVGQAAWPYPLVTCGVYQLALVLHTCHHLTWRGRFAVSLAVSCSWQAVTFNAC